MNETGVVTPRERAGTVLTFLRRPDTIAVIVLLALATMLLQWQQAAPTGESMDSYSSYDARSGGYKAWLQLVKKEQLEAGTFERHHIELDRSLTTLIYAEPLDGDPRANEMTPSDIADLESWVKAGGHLVYLGHDDGAAERGLLGLPFTAPPTPAPKPVPHATATPAARGIQKMFDDGSVAAALEKRAKLYTVDCNCVVGALTIAPSLRTLGVASLAPHAKYRYFVRPGKKVETLFADTRGAFAMRYPFGKGQVTTIVDETMFSNARIATGDHARLAYALASPGSVQFDEWVHGYFVPQQWYQVVPRPFAIAIAISIVAVLIAIGGASIRLGPPIVPFEREPTSVEFIDSLAGLFQRNKASRASLEDAVASVRRTVATSLGFQSSAPLDEILPRMRAPADRTDFAELVGLPARATVDDATLVRGLALAQRLRKDYAHGRQRN